MSSLMYALMSDEDRQLLAGDRRRARFMRSVDRRQDGCWIYGKGKINSYAMARIRIGEATKAMPAHRASWLLFRGEIPTNLWVLHKCDRPRCVNPDHLFTGTHQDNMRDMMSKGRNRPARRAQDHVQQLFETGSPGSFRPKKVPLVSVRNVMIPEELWTEIQALPATKRGWDPCALLAWLANWGMELHEAMSGIEELFDKKMESAGPGFRERLAECLRNGLGHKPKK